MEAGVGVQKQGVARFKVNVGEANLRSRFQLNPSLNFIEYRVAALGSGQ